MILEWKARRIWPIPTLADVFKARRAIAPYLQATPSLEAPELAAALGCRVVLKCENLNPTGAFKVRGGVNLLAALAPSGAGAGCCGGLDGKPWSISGIRRSALRLPGDDLHARSCESAQGCCDQEFWVQRSFKPAVISTRRGLRQNSMPSDLSMRYRALIE